ncbi:MAG: MFS transporter [Ignavibacteria bacterium]|jgi:MFS family permease|nr:MFS transporter [Ignavibacteria bacterium]MCU7501438.1 MFS transporter [Ignavibacteria bacterium]MCU7516046.1 MFS transporter [Ignavibacteria bacterium]
MPKKLLNRNFILLMQGQSISLLGNQVFSIAAIFWIKHLTDSASLIGLIGMISSIPAILLSSVGGAVADRYSRRKILIYCDALNGIAVLVLASVLYLSPGKTDLVLASFFAISLLMSVVNSFFQPAISAAVPDLVPREKITGANSLDQASEQVMTFLGQGIGGVLFRMLGAPMLIFFNGVSFLFAAICEVFIEIPQKIPEKGKDWKDQMAHFKKDVIEGFRYVWNNQGLKKMTLLFTFINFMTVPVIVLLPFYVEDFLKATADWYGFLLAMYGIGSMLGYILAGLLKLKGRLRAFTVLTFFLAESSGFGFLGLISSTATALVLAVIAGTLNGFVGVYIITALQVTTPSPMRGRVFGFISSLSGAMVPLSMGLAGFIFDATGKNIQLIYMSCGLIMFLIALVSLFSGDIRNFLSNDNDSDEVKIGSEVESAVK